MKALVLRNTSWLPATMLFAFAVAFVDGFVPRHTRNVIAAPIQAYNPYGHSGDEAGPLARNKARTDIRNLLTQRSIQSFVYLLNEVHDFPTTTWIEKILEFEKLDRFHGTGALNLTHFPSWDSFFLQMVAMNTETVLVEAKEKKHGHRGWSNKAGYLDNLNQKPKAKGNGSSSPKPQASNRGLSSGAGGYLQNLSNGNADLPHQEKSEKPSEANPYLEQILTVYAFEIDPASLLNRILSVREQISEEWTNDLESLFITNDEILTSYLDRQTEARKEEEEMQYHDMTFPLSDHSDVDRSFMVTLPNSLSSQDRASSPLRRSNFDLLVLLSTQESIHRVLREYSEEQEEENFDWLKDFYSKRVSTFFDGHGQDYGRADEFLEELIVSPPVARRTKNNKVHLIDPIKMVGDIIRERSEVAWEWKEVVATISSDHVGLRRLILTRRMMEEEDDEVDNLPTFSAIPKAKQRSKEGIFEAGAFE